MPLGLAAVDHGASPPASSSRGPATGRPPPSASPPATRSTPVRNDLDHGLERCTRTSGARPRRSPGFVVASALALWVHRLRGRLGRVPPVGAVRVHAPGRHAVPLHRAARHGPRAGRGPSPSTPPPLLGFLLLHRLARQEGTSHWVAERRTAGHRSLLTAGVGARRARRAWPARWSARSCPGADAAGRARPPRPRRRRRAAGHDQPARRHPLPARRPGRTSRCSRVRSTERAYWRLTSLERFDGRIWSSSGSYGKADGDLPESVDTDVATETRSSSTFAIAALAAIWLPERLRAPVVRRRGPRRPLRRGLRHPDRRAARSRTATASTYEVTSDLAPAHPGRPRPAPPTRSPTTSARASPSLPDGLQPATSRDARARRSPPAPTTPYEQARALQDYLRTFTYDLDVPPGHGGDALEQFLFDTKRGLLRAVRRRLRRDGPRHRPAVARGRRLHPRRGRPQRARPVPRPRRARPRLARGVLRRRRLGGLRADPGPGHAGGRALHGRARAAGRHRPARAAARRHRPHDASPAGRPRPTRARTT